VSLGPGAEVAGDHTLFIDPEQLIEREVT
jgi:hypothetical protein